MPAGSDDAAIHQPPLATPSHLCPHPGDAGVAAPSDGLHVVAALLQADKKASKLIKHASKDSVGRSRSCRASPVAPRPGGVYRHTWRRGRGATALKTALKCYGATPPTSMRHAASAGAAGGAALAAGVPSLPLLLDAAGTSLEALRVEIECLKAAAVRLPALSGGARGCHRVARNQSGVRSSVTRSPGALWGSGAPGVP